MFYGGAAGGGKSDALLGFSIGRRIKYPGSAGLFLRRSYADLSKAGAAISRSQEILAGTGAAWNGTEHKWRFPNGSVLEFGYMQTEDDRYNYQSAAYEDICWDEVTEFSELQYMFMLARCRTTRSDDCKSYIRSASNPINIGLAWVKRRFIDPMPPLTTFVEQVFDPSAGQTVPRTRCYVPATLADNSYLGAAYHSVLLSLPVAMRRALLEGSWDVFEGQVFGEFSRDNHVVTPFRIPPEWPRWFAVDFGTNVPGCVLWLSRSPDGIVYVYREVYAPMTATEQARAILQYSDSRQCLGNVGDPSLWNRDPQGQTVALTFVTEGVQDFQRAINDRLAGLQRVHEYLGDDKLRIFEPCLNLIRTLPQLIYDRHRPEDVDTSGEDHAYDALRYGLMGINRIPSREPNRDPYGGRR